MLRIPLNLDLSLHAAPCVALLLDFYLFEVKYSKRHARYGGAAVAAIAGIWYASWVEYCASYNGICEYHSYSSQVHFLRSCLVPYPFLTLNTFPVRVGIYSGATMMSYLFFQLLNAMHS